MEEKCYMCGTDDDKTVLFDAVVDDGIVKICEKCSIKEDVPLIKASGNVEDSSGKSNYERLSNMAGLDPEDHKSKFGPEQISENKDKNSSEKSSTQKKNDLSFPKLNYYQAEQKEDLIRNFHWSIMKARRAQGYTYKSLAEAISEPEETVRHAERGVLPEKYYVLIRKIQLTLGITLFEKPKKEKKAFSQKSNDSATIDDLRERKKNLEDSEERSGYSEDDVDEDFEEPEEEKVPLWKRVVNFFKQRRRKRSEGPLEVPEEELEKDLNLAKAEDIDAPGVEKTEKENKEESQASPSSGSNMESLKRREKQVGGTFESKKDHSSNQGEYRKSVGEKDGSKSSGNEPQTAEKKSKEENLEGSDELSQEEIDRIAFGGK